MAVLENPSLAAFIVQVAGSGTQPFAQVLIRSRDPGFELRHVADADRASETLQDVPLAKLRVLAQATASGAFRPLKSAPNLVSGWRCLVPGPAELGEALDQLYPGAVADWHAARQPSPPITHYRDFSARQTGMYRLTALLEDHQAADMARACCHPRHCLKHCLWTTPGEPAEPAEAKSIIPCLEPCALLLEFARKTARNLQETPCLLAGSVAEFETLREALRRTVDASSASVAEADFNAPANPRCAEWMLQKVSRALEEAREKP